MTTKWVVKNKPSPEGYVAIWGGKKSELVKEFRARGMKPDIRSKQDWGNWYFIVPRDFGLELTESTGHESGIYSGARFTES